MANPFPFSAGSVLTAADMNSIGEWTSFTPSLDFSGNTITPDTLAGRYAVINGVKIVQVRAYDLVFSGSGNFNLNLPSDAAISPMVANQRCGFGSFYDNSLNDQYLCAAYHNSTSTTLIRFLTQGAATVTNTVPFTFTSGADEFDCTLIGKQP